MVYLDNAATSRPKPRAVYAAAARAMQTMASPGRGGYSQSTAAAAAVYVCREKAAQMFNARGPENVIFTQNATHALNIAIKGFVRPGGHAVISGYEHNSVVRPLNSITGVTTDIAESPLFGQDEAMAAFEKLVTPRTSCVICTCVSNVFGYILPYERICALCAKTGVPCVLDASQAAGCIGLDIQKLGADALCMPGHKGLYGPQGTGLLILGDRRPGTLMEGGTGSESENPMQPAEIPERYESGTQNVPGIAGLSEGLSFVAEKTPEAILAHETRLSAQICRELGGLRGITLYTGEKSGFRTGVLSFSIGGTDCVEAAEMLAASGYAVRAGLHCSPLAHSSAGTLGEGTVRVSPGAFSTYNDITGFCRAVFSLRGRRIY